MNSACTGFESTVGMSRRQILKSFGMGLGSMALADMIGQSVLGASAAGPNFPAKAKRVIFLFQSGGPSQMDLYDYKPMLNERHGQELPASIRGNQRLTAMSGNQASLPLAGSPFKFKQYGESRPGNCEPVCMNVTPGP